MCGLRACATWFPDERDATNAVESIGLADIEFGSHPGFYECPRDAVYTREFSALDMRGRYVDGVVCCSDADACSVRLK